MKTIPQQNTDHALHLPLNHNNLLVVFSTFNIKIDNKLEDENWS